jgi:hypothetical protein
MCRGGHLAYSCLSAGRCPTDTERDERMLYHDLDYGLLGKERLVQMRKEIEHNRLEASLAKEARLAKAASLSEEARLAKACLSEEAVLRSRSRLTRGTTFVTALFR